MERNPHTALIEIVSSAVQLNFFTVTINHELPLILTVALSVYVPKRLLVKARSQAINMLAAVELISAFQKAGVKKGLH